MFKHCYNLKFLSKYILCRLEHSSMLSNRNILLFRLSVLDLAISGGKAVKPSFNQTPRVFRCNFCWSLLTFGPNSTSFCWCIQKMSKVALLFPWIGHFVRLTSAWWILSSNKVNSKARRQVKRNLEKGNTQAVVEILSKG